ncbi:MAG: sporulation protein YtfJ [Bacilli bacterium]|nr:sporulation protein YtfJ [Bacilli bacterium]
MSEHQISNLLNVSMDNLKEMVKAGMIVGDPIQVSGGVLFPIVKVKCGLVSGGMDQGKKTIDNNMSFSGASASTLSLTPLAIVSCVNNEVKLLHMEESSHIIEKAIDSISNTINKLIDKTSSKN